MGQPCKWWQRTGDLLRLVWALPVLAGLLLESVESILPILVAWSFLVSPLIAIKKGFAPYYWLFACGPIGLLAIISLAPLKSAKNPEEYERLENRANWIGGVLSWIGVFIASIVVALTTLSDFCMANFPDWLFPE